MRRRGMERSWLIHQALAETAMLLGALQAQIDLTVKQGQGLQGQSQGQGLDGQPSMAHVMTTANDLCMAFRLEGSQPTPQKSRKAA